MTERILILAPHTDDGELGCGGTIAKFIEEKKEVYYATFSLAEKSLPKGYPKNTLEIEMKKATKVLGIPVNNLKIFKYEVRRFSYYRQEILDDLLKIKKDINPDIIFMPSLNDMHQDHTTIAEEGRRIFKKDTLLGYELPWNNITFNTFSFMPLEERHIVKKIDALKCYKTQEYRTYLNKEFIRGLAIARGTQIDRPFAEAFEVIRWIMG